MIDWSKPLRTKMDRRPAKWLGKVPPERTHAPEYTEWVKVGDSAPAAYCKDGRFHYMGRHTNDLENVPEEPGAIDVAFIRGIPETDCLDLHVPEEHVTPAKFECTPVEPDTAAVPSSHDPVSNPSHYRRFPIEPFRFIEENHLPFWLGNVIKYCMRWDAKDGIQDLKKAQRNLEMTIKRLEGDPDWWK